MMERSRELFSAIERFRPKGNHLKILLLYLLILIDLKTISSVNATKCYACLFQLAHCTNPLDCYNQPDTCSNTNFSPIYAPTIECEFGCEQYVITDATGSIVVWHRGCGTDKSPRSSYLCFSRNIYFLRHEQCWCHQDYCNSSESTTSLRGNIGLMCTIISLLTSFVVIRSPIHL